MPRPERDLTTAWATPPGRSARGLVAPDVGADVDLPWFVVRGSEPGPTLLVSAGVHGAEYASIEAAYRAAEQTPEGLRGTLLVLPILCPPSYAARSVYVNPVDGLNLNRVFPGRADGSFAERLAAWSMREAVAHADAWIDLHGGDLIESLVPFSIHAASDPASRELAEAFGLELRIASDAAGMTCAEGARAGVPSVLAEAGGQGRWPASAVAPLLDGIERVQRHLGMREGPLEPRTVRELTTFAWLRSEHAGRWHPRATAGDEVRAGQLLGIVSDLLGNELQRAVAPVAGTVVFAVESLAIGADDPLMGIGA
jgi:predicted deacylase